MLFGQGLRLPGDIFIPDPSQSQYTSSTDVITSMKKFAASITTLPTRVEQHPPVHLPSELETCTHMFIKESSNCPNLTPAYFGPFVVVDRNAYTLKVAKKDKILSVSVNNVKPAFRSPPDTSPTPTEVSPLLPFSMDTSQSSPTCPDAAVNMMPGPLPDQDIEPYQNHAPSPGYAPSSPSSHTQGDPPPKPPRLRRHARLPVRLHDYVLDEA